MTEARLERATICGVSFGGLIAVRFAASFPSRCEALILASTPKPRLRLRPRHQTYLRAPWIFGPIFLAETPFRLRPEIDELNFLPRVTVPVVMINGRYDHIFPVEPSQKPFFERLGTAPANKTSVLLAGGHSSPRNELIQIVLGGLDRYLGPVEKR